MHHPLILLALALTCLQSASAKTIHLTTGNKSWFTTLSGPSLQPGDEIILAAGTYTDARRLQISQRGTAERPITIRAATDAKVILKRPDTRQNSINLTGCQHLIVKDIEITGGAAAIRIGKQGEHLAKFITLENLHIHHIGGVAVTANNPSEIYECLTFRHNHIHHTGGHGEGFYLGSNNKPDGSTNGYIFNSVIENNYIHDLKGDTVSQGDGIELKDGSFNNIIRDNVIHDTNYPGIIVYDTDGKAPNIIERNAVWNTGDHGIQAAADAIIRNNVIFDTAGEGIHCRNHQSAIVGNLKIVHNTILTKTPIRIVPPNKFSGKVLVANNALGGLIRIPTSTEITQRNNVIGIREQFPSAGSKCIGGADPTHLASDDFNGTERADSKDAGAYTFSASGNPAPAITRGFKDPPKK
ncbi:MAG: parallel beta-helix repeat protein [Verrucomicrobiales bacterium]|jgi:parallel beta-helix repeat protein